MNTVNEKYEAVIGIEVHVELKTDSKIFCPCSTHFGDAPNSNICPVCMGMPGTLPVLNEKAVELALRAGLAFGCTLNRTSWFDRKNYYYPDLPKGYQITQNEMPVCIGGYVEIIADGETKKIRLNRIHIEEDAAKLLHRGDETLIDYNRSGVPLIEIVSEPDIRTSGEAKSYLDVLRRTLSFIGVSDCRMNEGSLRCDVNVSVRERGSGEMGIKCEIKNLNSVNFVGRAIEYEIKRQSALLDAGADVEPETRRYCEEDSTTVLMRKKESAVDYRYFTEPDIPPVILTDEYISRVAENMPALPRNAEEELVRDYGVKREAAVIISASAEIMELYKTYAAAFGSSCGDGAGETAVNLFVSEIVPLCENGIPDSIITPENFAEAVHMFTSGEVVSGVARQLIRMSAEEKLPPMVIAKRNNMLKIKDRGELIRYANDAIRECGKAAEDYKAGKKTAIKQLMGHVMRASGGFADPVLCGEILEEILGKTKP